jgi:hypothetical protein
VGVPAQTALDSSEAAASTDPSSADPPDPLGVLLMPLTVIGQVVRPGAGKPGAGRVASADAAKPRFTPRQAVYRAALSPHPGELPRKLPAALRNAAEAMPADACRMLHAINMRHAAAYLRAGACENRIGSLASWPIREHAALCAPLVATDALILHAACLTAVRAHCCAARISAEADIAHPRSTDQG